MKFIDLFAGVGGVRLGLEKANQGLEGDGQAHLRLSGGREAFDRSGDDNPQADRPSGRAGDGPHAQSHFECVWSCEIDRWCRAVYKYHWGKVEAGDARRVDTKGIPDFDLLVAGFPCQAFSVAGKRRGFQDIRGTLFFEIVRILKDKRPRYFLLENVKGLLSHESGKTFQTILEVLSNLGYILQWEVLNSKHFGVPQNRERVFVVGHLGGIRGREVFPVGEADEVALGEVEGGPAVQAEAGAAVHSRYGAGWRAHGQEQLISTAIDRHYGRGPDKHGQMTVIAEGKPMMAQLVGDRDNPSVSTYKDSAPTISANPMSDRVPVVIPAPIRFLNRNQRNFDPDTAMTVDTACSTGVAILDEKYFYTKKELETIRQKKAAHPWIRWKSGIKGEGAVPFPDDPSKPARTVTTQEGKPNRMTHGIPSGVRIRRLTPRECERLQGFPDDWTRWGTDDKGNKFELSDTQRYRQMGNAVTVNVVEFLARRLAEVM